MSTETSHVVQDFIKCTEHKILFFKVVICIFNFGNGRAVCIRLDLLQKTIILYKQNINNVYWKALQSDQKQAETRGESSLVRELYMTF